MSGGDGRTGRWRRFGKPVRPAGREILRTRDVALFGAREFQIPLLELRHDDDPVPQGRYQGSQEAQEDVGRADGGGVGLQLVIGDIGIEMMIGVVGDLERDDAREEAEVIPHVAPRYRPAFGAHDAVVLEVVEGLDPQPRDQHRSQRRRHACPAGQAVGDGTWVPLEVANLEPELQKASDKALARMQRTNRMAAVRNWAAAITGRFSTAAPSTSEGDPPAWLNFLASSFA